MQEKETAALDTNTLRHQFQELQERASKDALSGLLNRQTAESYISARLKEMTAEQTCALFIIDLDHFKQVNDTLGHQAGDWAIRQSAKTLSGLFRARDIIGRLGGDEFIVFLSGQITEKLVRKKGALICQRLQIALGSDPVLNLSASVGIHLASGASLDFNALYQSADHALYKAKGSGRRRFCLHMDEDLLDQQAETDIPFNAIPLNELLEYMDSGVALVEIGSSMRIIYVSPSFCRMVGMPPHEFALPRQLEDFVHPDDVADLQAVLQEGLRSGRTVEHVHRISGDGSQWSWWHIRAGKIEYNSACPVMLVTSTDISSYKENEYRLQELNDRLRIAFEQTNQTMWEVDLSNRTIRLFSSRFAGPDAAGQDFPEALISSGWVHPDSAQRFREFARELLAGNIQGYGNFIIRYEESGCYRWTALSYRMLYDKDGRALRAVGILEELPKNFSGEAARSIMKRPLPEALVPNLVVHLCANLTRNSIRELWAEGRRRTSSDGTESCCQFLRSEERRIFSPDDRKELQKFFDRDMLLQSFEAGQQWLSAEYRRIDGSGNIRWVSRVDNLAEDPLTHEIYLFSYLSLCEQRHQWEASLDVRITHDPITGLYENEIAQSMTDMLLREQSSAACALVLLHIYGMSPVSEGMERERRYLAQAFSVALGTSCIMAQRSPDEILLFYPVVHSADDLHRQLESAFAFVRLVLAETVRLEQVHFAAGAVCREAAGADYEAMLSDAFYACALRENTAMDTVSFPQKGGNGLWNQVLRQKTGNQIRISTCGGSRPLSGPEKDVALQCISSMLDADSLETSIHTVLHHIGTFHHADRVYILKLTNGGPTVTMLYEWNSGEKQSIRHVVSGIPLEQAPLLQRCLKEASPIFLEQDKQPSLRQPQEPACKWHFAAFPLTEDGKTKGFLCIENAQAHEMDSALCSSLLPYLLREKRRFQNQLSSPGDQALSFPAALPNLRAYLETIHSVTSDRYSSLGVVCLDIPELSAINCSTGFAYGDRMLDYIAKALDSIFGNRFLFRTGDAEFVVLCPNTTHQVFSTRCMRLRQRMQQQYPQATRIGYSWTSGVFNGKRLVDEARKIMHCRQVRPPLLNEHQYTSTGEAIHAGRFTVFFQPKINICTGELAGAEALVRGLDESGNIVPPASFIEEMEEKDDIRDLDLFVLDRTLMQMDRWREQGYPLFRVSINISRVTLFHSSLLASILAIQSRYPQLPDGLLELEITESAGNVGKVMLNKIIGGLREHSLRFALDDFGSQYANLSTFANVNFDTVKLDRSLIADLAGNEINRMLVRDIVQICQKQGMECIAEGIETKAQLAVLQKAGCVYAQGYYYDRPLPAKRFEKKYLQQQGRPPADAIRQQDMTAGGM